MGSLRLLACAAHYETVVDGARCGWREGEHRRAHERAVRILVWAAEDAEEEPDESAVGRHHVADKHATLLCCVL